MRKAFTCFRMSLVAAAVLAATGCATTSVSIATDAGVLRTGASTVRTHAADAFQAGNEVARQNSIQRKLDLAEASPGHPADHSLREDDFPLAVARADIAKWDQAFVELGAYFVALQSLVDPARSSMTGDALTNLATQLQSGSTQASLPPGVAATFATLAQALVQARAEHEAAAVMRRVDPAFSALTQQMAEAIGADNNSGLRGTVWANWEATLAADRANYANAQNATARRSIITAFLQAMDARDTQIRNLEQLRASILALGEAHSAAARGSRGDVMFWIDRVDSWLGDVKQRRQTLTGSAGGN
jgi:hypothetical protein